MLNCPKADQAGGSARAGSQTARSFALLYYYTAKPRVLSTPPSHIFGISFIIEPFSATSFCVLH